MEGVVSPFKGEAHSSWLIQDDYKKVCESPTDRVPPDVAQHSSVRGNGLFESEGVAVDGEDETEFVGKVYTYKY
jgi:hypothetical protein